MEDWEAKLDDLAYIFSRIEEYSRKEMLQNLRNKRRLRTMPSQNDIIEEERWEKEKSDQYIASCLFDSSLYDI